MVVDPKKRSYRIVKVSNNRKNIDFESGIYHGRPIQAAKKAFNSFCRKSKVRTCDVVFTIREITRGSKNKEYKYHGKRKRLNPPKEINRGGNVITIKYENTVRKA